MLPDYWILLQYLSNHVPIKLTKRYKYKYNTTMPRRGSYVPDGDTALARCRVSVSAQHDDQDVLTFWERVAQVFSVHLEAA